MSLFRVCSWWMAQEAERYANFSAEKLLVCRLNLQETEKDCIVLASEAGVVKIYYPSSFFTDGYVSVGYRPANLFLECNLKSPILSLVAGNFESGSSKDQECKNQLAILHPLSVALYGVVKTSGRRNSGTQYKLQLLVDHPLPKWSFSICKGYFGGIQNKECFCVTHLDGSLTFFEQNGISFKRHLAGDVSMPYSITYDPKSDAFLRINSCWELQSFSYQEISECGASATVTSTWSLCLGEPHLQILPVRISNSRTNIMVLGESNLFNVSDEGKIIFVKKLDYVPLCFYSFVLGWYWEQNARLITLIVSHTGQLLIYDNTTLLWAAQFETTPVAVLRSNLNGLPGGLVLLSANGLVHVGFLGSEPYDFKTPLLDRSNHTSGEAHKELYALEEEIRKSIDFTNMIVNNKFVEKDIELFVNFSHDAFKYSLDELNENRLKNRSKALLTLNFRVNVKPGQLHFTFNADHRINFTERILTFTDIEAGANYVADVLLHIPEDIQIFSTRLEVIISFINEQNVSRVINKYFFFPPDLIYEVTSLQNNDDRLANFILYYSRRVQLFNIADFVSELVKLKKPVLPESESIVIVDTKSRNCVRLYDNKAEHELRSVCLVAKDRLTRYSIFFNRLEYSSIEVMPAILDLLMHHFSAICESAIGQTGRKENAKLITCSPALPVAEILNRVAYYREIQQKIREKTVREKILISLRY